MQSNNGDVVAQQGGSLVEPGNSKMIEKVSKARSYIDDVDDADDYLCSSYPPGKRLAPVGANEEDDKKAMDEMNESPKRAYQDEGDAKLKFKLQQMEADQEDLNNSLMALTSHFAKVQLRLQQVVSAPAERRDELLKELEQFAFRAIPNVSSPRPPDRTFAHSHSRPDPDLSAHSQADHIDHCSPDMTNSEILEAQRKKHQDLIYQLKGQLEELESYAYECGEGSVPSNWLLERQRIVMEQLRTRLNLKVDNIEKLSTDELRAQVDSAVGQIVHPLKMKSQLVNQLQTQIQDLEMFIDFLQGEASTMVPLECNGCGCSKHNSPEKGKDGVTHRRVPRYLTRSKSEQEEIRQHTVTILDKAMTVLQMVTLAQFGCGAETFSKNSLKNTPKGNHYGDLRAHLEMAVDHVLEVCSNVECITDTDCTSAASGSDSQPEYLMSSSQVASVVRKELAIAIRDLMHHGILSESSRGSLIPLMGCMSAKTAARGSRGSTHAWAVILKYYDMKQGREYNSAPARKLSQSFGLDLTGSSSSTKQSFLATIGQILASHLPYKRSQDAQFKAFVCAGLNQKKLIPWLRLIFRNQSILESFYAPWSYVMKTGFDDAFRSLERLSIYAFNLPVNIAVRQFQDMNEAF